MKLGFKQRILVYFSLIFISYTIGIVLIEQNQEIKYRTGALQSKLDGFAELIHTYVEQHGVSEVASITSAMPDDIRITIIDNEGQVLYDKNIQDYKLLENHLDRVELKTALYQGVGTNIRQSASTKQEYFYYAKHYGEHYVRVALPYTIATQNLLKADNYFMYSTIVLFILVSLMLYWVANRFNTSILNLKELTNKVKNHAELPRNLSFSEDELGDISKELVYILQQKEKSKIEIELEREKLRKHFQYSEEGLAIFDSIFSKKYVNTHFIQYANLITEGPTLDVDNIFDDPSFAKITNFVMNDEREKNHFTSQVAMNGKVFLLKAIVFDDHSFELTIKDITQQEKTRVLKQEMTSNIAHELRTPVTALRGYLETLHEQDLSTEKRSHFVEKAYLQSIRLSNIIEDVSLLSKIEEEKASFSFQKVNMSQLIDNVQIDVVDRLIANEVTVTSKVKSTVTVTGNYTLLFSAIRNLVDNSLNYAGKGIKIYIDAYMEDEDYYYFSYYDTGVGVNEAFLPKLFERFYRIDEGRDRNSGGSGLGLSIVKNTILLHKGTIEAKKHVGSGLEFLFKLRK